VKLYCHSPNTFTWRDAQLKDKSLQSYRETSLKRNDMESCVLYDNLIYHFEVSNAVECNKTKSPVVFLTYYI